MLSEVPTTTIGGIPLTLNPNGKATPTPTVMQSGCTESSVQERYKDAHLSITTAPTTPLAGEDSLSSPGTPEDDDLELPNFLYKARTRKRPVFLAQTPA